MISVELNITPNVASQKKIKITLKLSAFKIHLKVQ